MERKVGIIGAPFESGQKYPGLLQSPDFIRGPDLISAITKLDYDISDYGNIEVAVIEKDENIYKARSPRTFNQNTFKCVEFVEKSLMENKYTIVLGGDRTVCTGSILAHANVDKDICVVFVGRKANLHTVMSSPTGYMNEMSLFLLLSEMQVEVPWINEFQYILPILSTQNFGLIGLHDVDDYEKYVINKHGIKSMSTAVIDRLGMEAVIRETTMTINPNFLRPIHLCFNVDAFDPMYGPSVADRTNGGLTLREAIRLCEFLHNTGQLRVIDIMEFNPLLGTDKENRITRTSIVESILAAIGSKRCGIPGVDPNFYLWEKFNLRRTIKFKKENLPIIFKS